MEYEVYSKTDILEKLKSYFEYKLKLEKNKNDIMVFCNNDFWFSARNKSTMDKIDNIALSEIFKSCNLIESPDDTFYDEKDLLDELNSLVDCKNIVEYMKTFLEEVYGAECIVE